MNNGVKTLIFDLKKRIKYEVKGLHDTTKVKLLPHFNYKTMPLALTVRYD